MFSTLLAFTLSLSTVYAHPHHNHNKHIARRAPAPAHVIVKNSVWVSGYGWINRSSVRWIPGHWEVRQGHRYWARGHYILIDRTHRRAR